MLLSNFLSLTPLLETTIFLSVPDEKHNSFFREEIFDRNYIYIPTQTTAAEICRLFRD